MSFFVQVLSKKNRAGFYCSDSMFEDAIAKFGEGAKVIVPGYSDYGGSLYDRATIEYFKESEPELIVWETLSYRGQHAIIKVEDDECVGYAYDLAGLVDDKYVDLENEMIKEDAKEYCEWHNCDALRDEVEQWIADNACPIPNRMDYCESDLDEYIMPLIVENMSEPVKAAVIKGELDVEMNRLERLKWQTGDMDSAEFKAYESAIEILQGIVNFYA